MATKQARDLHRGDIVRLPQGLRTVESVTPLGSHVQVAWTNGKASVVPGSANVIIQHADMIGGAL